MASADTIRWEYSKTSPGYMVYVENPISTSKTSFLVMPGVPQTNENDLDVGDIARALQHIMDRTEAHYATKN